MEQRRYPRVHGLAMHADISDGKRFFSGSVANISRLGLCLEDIPSRLDTSAKKISVVITDGKKTFKMTTRSCWSWQKQIHLVIGMEILKVPWGWTEYVTLKEPAGDDPWAETHL